MAVVLRDSKVTFPPLAVIAVSKYWTRTDWSRTRDVEEPESDPCPTLTLHNDEWKTRKHRTTELYGLLYKSGNSLSPHVHFDLHST